MLYPYVPIEKRLLTDKQLKDIGKQLHRAGIVPSTAIGRAAALGALVHLWAMADDHCGEDNQIEIDREDLAAAVGFDLIAFLPANWCRPIGADVFELPDFREKNSSLARARQGARERRREQRAAARSAGAQAASPSESRQLSRQPALSESRLSTTPELASYRATDLPTELTVTAQQFFARLLDIYPQAPGALQRERCAAECQRIVRTKAGRWEDIIAGAQRMRDFCAATKRPTKYTKTLLAFLQEDQWKEQFVVPPDEGGGDLLAFDAAAVRAAIDRQQQTGGSA